MRRRRYRSRYPLSVPFLVHVRRAGFFFHDALSPIGETLSAKKVNSKHDDDDDALPSSNAKFDVPLRIFSSPRTARFVRSVLCSQRTQPVRFRSVRPRPRGDGRNEEEKRLRGGVGRHRPEPEDAVPRAVVAARGLQRGHRRVRRQPGARRPEGARHDHRHRKTASVRRV